MQSNMKLQVLMYSIGIKIQFELHYSSLKKYAGGVTLFVLSSSSWELNIFQKCIYVF